MPTSVDRAEVRRLVAEEDAQLAEVLPRGEYDDEHLPGAVHLPLKQLAPTLLALLTGLDRWSSTAGTPSET